MRLFGKRKTWDELCQEYDDAVLAGDHKRVHAILKQKLAIALAENDPMKRLVVNSEWLGLKQRIDM